MVYTATDRGSACPRAESSKFPSFFLISTSQKGDFHQIVKKSQNLPYKKLFFKGYESVIKVSPAARTAQNPPSMDMQPFPHIHAALRPTYPLVVAKVIIQTRPVATGVFSDAIFTIITAKMMPRT
jgi:hypothetical protein